MKEEKLKSFLTSFTADGCYFSVLWDNTSFKIWNTNNGSLLADWKLDSGDPEIRFSSMACSFLRKKRKKEQGSCMVAFGADNGDIFAIDALTCETKWKSFGFHCGGIVGLSFANKGHNLHVVGREGWASEMNTKNGDLLRKFKVSKRSISSSAFSCDGKTIVSANSKMQVSNFESGDELLKFSSELGLLQYISVSEDAKFIVTFGLGEKQLKMWKCDLSAKTLITGPDLSVKHSPIAIECKTWCNGEEYALVQMVSESGVVYLWRLDTSTWKYVNPTKITVKAKKGEKDLVSGRKSRNSILASKLQAQDTDGQVKVLVAYGSIDCVQFSSVDISGTGENVTIIAGDETMKLDVTSQEDEILLRKGLLERELETRDVPVKKKKIKKKRSASDPDIANAETYIENGHEHSTDVVQAYDDLNEPTMGEKLASLNLVSKNEDKNLENTESSPRAKPPSADSVHLLLKQALHADDRALLLNCLYSQDEKVISNSVSVLNPSDVLKFFKSLVSIIQSRGAVLACALPWLRSLLLHHASGIMAQESSLIVLNSLYQLIESRVSTFQRALKLSSYLDLIYSRAVDVDDAMDVHETIIPVIYEDTDDSEAEGSEEAMETDSDEELETYNGLTSDVDGSDDDIEE